MEQEVVYRLWIIYNAYSHIAPPKGQLGRRYLAVVKGTHNSRNRRSLTPRFIRYRLVTVLVAPLRRTTYLENEATQCTEKEREVKVVV